jgi:CO/xanthine dehydrogenase FAD-binding subunit
VSSLALVDVGSVSDALRALRSQPDLVPLAGCTDLFVQLNAGQLRGARFLNLWRLDDLRGIEVRQGRLVLGALSTYAEVLASPLVREHLPMLVAASREVGAVQIQQRGTLGGNLANASPAGDTLPVFAAADALVVLRSLDGERRIPVTQFYSGYRRTLRHPDELIVALEVPPVAGVQWFRKVGARAAQAISKVVIAAVRAPVPRIAVGSVAPTVVRLRETERLLASGAPLAAAQAALERDISPIDDVRSTARYRMAVARNLLARFWTDTQSCS